jgi:hypothetical protein
MKRGHLAPPLAGPGKVPNVRVGLQACSCDTTASCLPPETWANATSGTNRTNLDFAGALGQALLPYHTGRLLDLRHVLLYLFYVAPHLVELIGPLIHGLEPGREAVAEHLAELFFGHVYLLREPISQEPGFRKVADTHRVGLITAKNPDLTS